MCLGIKYDGTANQYVKAEAHVYTLQKQSKANIADLFQENMQLRMRIWVHSNFKERNKDIVQDVLE